MADGLIAAYNLGDVASVDKTWDNLGNNVTFTVSGTAYAINVTGEDIIQISGAHFSNNEDFFQLRGLTSPAQPRLNNASFLVSSGVSLNNSRLLEHNPVSSGFYVLNPGTLSGVAIQTNGVNIGSIGGSPFLASGAISKISLSHLQLTSDTRLADTFGSGTLASGIKGIPVEYSDLILYIRAEPV
jgi:hypothetical protein